MKLNDYQREASGTAIYPGRLSPHGMMYCALKMNGEAGELAEHLLLALNSEGFVPGHLGMRPDRMALIVKEVGDVMWYLAAMCDELETDLRFIYGAEVHVPKGIYHLDREIIRLNAEVGQIAEQIGKAMRDDGYGMPAGYVPGALREGDPGNGRSAQADFTGPRRSKIMNHMRNAAHCLAFICHDLGISLEHAMEINIRKLAARKAKGTLSGSGDNR